VRLVPPHSLFVGAQGGIWCCSRAMPRWRACRFTASSAASTCGGGSRSLSPGVRTVTPAVLSVPNDAPNVGVSLFEKAFGVHEQ